MKKLIKRLVDFMDLLAFEKRVRQYSQEKDYKIRYLEDLLLSATTSTDYGGRYEKGEIFAQVDMIKRKREEEKQMTDFISKLHKS